MIITTETTIGDLMILLEESKPHLSNYIDDPLPEFVLYGDGSFRIEESFYKASATSNSTVNINNIFTSFDISNNIINRLIEKDRL